jgi:hypothetical protein
MQAGQSTREHINQAGLTKVGSFAEPLPHNKHLAAGQANKSIKT